jgi:Na+/melibiose symporter-like transporter
LRTREKHRVWAAASCAAGVLHLLNAFLTPHIGLWFFAISICFQLFAMASEAVPLAIIGDLVDHNLLRRGANCAGQYAALAMAVRKACLGLGAAAALAITGAFEFKPGAATYASGQVTGLKLAFVALPALGFLLSAALMWNFPLDSRRQAIIRRRIAAAYRGSTTDEPHYIKPG